VGEFPKIDITTPLFDKTILKFPSQENANETVTFEINAKRLNSHDIYIQNAWLNGKEWKSFQFPASDFLKGGILELELGPEPNKQWGLNE